MSLKQINAQMNKERQNSAQYAAFADALESVNWPGFAAWMRKSAAEELEHYCKFSDYLIDRNFTPIHTALDAPQKLDGEKPLPIFEAALALEVENTKTILSLEEAADNEKDGQTCAFLYTWAIPEQTSSVRDLTDRVKELSRQEAAGLLLLDREYGE
jgi:ferritin